MLDRVVSALDMSIWSVFDILVLAVIIYQLLLMIRGTRAVNVLVAIAVLVLCYVLTGPGLLKLSAVHTALYTLLFYIPLAAIVLFQNQIRQALAHLGKNPLSVFVAKRVEENLIQEVSLAAASLASKRLGALIVIERGIGLRTFSETGIALDALVSYDLLLNIFTRRSPMHDGAVIIAEGRIKAASCYLPLTTNPTLSRSYGTRHRAGIGLTEESDALVVIVSEETGGIALAAGGKISGDLDARSLAHALRRVLGPKPEPQKRTSGEPRVVATGPSDA